VRHVLAFRALPNWIKGGCIVPELVHNELVKFVANNKVATLNSVGLFLTIVGVLLLFRFEIAFQVRTGGGFILTTQRTPELIQHQRRCMRWSVLALVCIVVGTFCQIIANWV
jgi:hypothetical protein